MDYLALAARIAALTEDETDEVALMATVACEVHHSDARFDWTGFYRVVAPELLKIGPYQGGHGCLVIPTRSELVLPVWNGAGQLIGVFDIDSDQPAAFTAEDETALADILADAFAKARRA